MTPLNVKLAISGIAIVATEAFLCAQLRFCTFDEMRECIVTSVYWPDFTEAVAAGEVQAENWLPGALGRVILDWAREGRVNQLEGA